LLVYKCDGKVTKAQIRLNRNILLLRNLSRSALGGTYFFVCADLPWYEIASPHKLTCGGQGDWGHVARPEDFIYIYIYEMGRGKNPVKKAEKSPAISSPRNPLPPLHTNKRN
jgi:hypothetical protein